MKTPMKFLTIALALASVSAPAFARSYETVLDRAMSLKRCRAAIVNYARTNGLELEMWQENNYYLNSEGQKVGNAYYSSGRCYIYLNQ